VEVDRNDKAFVIRELDDLIEPLTLTVRSAFPPAHEAAVKPCGSIAHRD